MYTIWTLHGPNLNLLGIREPGHYGQSTLLEIDETLKNKANERGAALSTYQRNSESELIELIHQAYEHKVDAIIFNPAAFTHTSIALRDALLAVSIPFVEVHLSNIFAREPFRQHSYFSDIAMGVITGLGAESYYYALNTLINHLNHKQYTQSDLNLGEAASSQAKGAYNHA
ncbi:MAG: 3-dehydroquinate dehydratase [Gammaproteobacteria bacterium]|jgi:3-dehydroquinate dehydratase-2|nr:3-dehydroquinate dehydratase [Gammaproteobacteria bacterium]